MKETKITKWLFFFEKIFNVINLLYYKKIKRILFVNHILAKSIYLDISFFYSTLSQYLIKSWFERWRRYFYYGNNG